MARLYALIARQSSRAVIFRRGPSKRVLLLSWDTDTDDIEEGQWLNGRIYERRCDLSPQGDLLVYFAASYKPPLFSWSAISRPPFLTALALWPKGDGWGGGGHFLNATTLALNHRSNEMVLAEDFTLPKWLTITSFGNGSGWGEDLPIWFQRLERDGWLLTSAGRVSGGGSLATIWSFDPPIIWEKPSPTHPKRFTLQMIIHGISERNGPWYVTEHRLLARSGQSMSLGRTEWSDWSSSGDVLFARGSSLFRIRFGGVQFPHKDAPKEIVDLSSAVFSLREPTAGARIWPKR